MKKEDDAMKKKADGMKNGDKKKEGKKEKI